MATGAHTPKEQSERYGAGDTYLILDVLPPEVAETAMKRLREEVKWSRMMHRGEFVILRRLNLEFVNLDWKHLTV